MVFLVLDSAVQETGICLSFYSRTGIPFLNFVTRGVHKVFGAGTAVRHFVVNFFSLFFICRAYES